MEIDKKLHNEIKEYCKLNGLKMNEFINHLIKKSFNIEKYGLSPFSPRNDMFVPEEKEVVIVDKVPTVIDEETTIELVDNEEVRIEEPRKKKRKLK